MSTVAFQGLSGNSYTFTAYPITQAFLEFGAVYIITKRYVDANNQYRFSPIYIGITGDMSTRFDDHHKADCFTRNGANFICVHSDNTDESRRSKETDLIRYWNPICNG